MFETENLTEEVIKQRRKDKSRNRKRTIKRHCCSLCGEPKHYVCLEHHPNQRNKGFRKLWKKLRYNSKNLYFNWLKH